VTLKLAEDRHKVHTFVAAALARESLAETLRLDNLVDNLSCLLRNIRTWSVPLTASAASPGHTPFCMSPVPTSAYNILSSLDSPAAPHRWAPLPFKLTLDDSSSPEPTPNYNSLHLPTSGSSISSSGSKKEQADE
jgi:hypothetical protein